MKTKKILILLIVILIIGNIYQFYSTDSESLDTNYITKKIESNRKKLDSIESVRSDYNEIRNRKMDSLKIILGEIGENVKLTKRIEKDEKNELIEASNDDNYEFFVDYIKRYRARKEESQK